MSKHCIGVYFDEGVERLRTTLFSLRASGLSCADMVVLLSGTEEEEALQAAREMGVRTSSAKGATSAAHAFNRLITSGGADIYIFLEAGCIVGPGWLDRLLAALHSNPRIGLAGPSTNRAWNQQCVFPSAQGTPEEVARTAGQAARQFGARCQSLEPLHSLSDFCYVVKREVVEKVGAADEAYGSGPCWEMDYNIRAHRAGFLAVWACGSYVYREAFTPRRAREEEANFTNSRHLYQDKFCGLRLARPGSSAEYRPHCRGDACANFAPAHLIQLHIPFASGIAAPVPPMPPTGKAPSQPEGPLISCIMVTRDRPEFVLQAIRYFQRQDYANRELIILDDGRDDLVANIERDDRIRYIRLRGPLTIGAKRNRGCELAHGTYIAHWDDDDWYAPDRLSKQLAPLFEGRADISALQAEVFFDLARWQFWRCTATLHKRMFVEDVHGGTLVYKRSCWQQHTRYPEVSLAEDAAFLRQAMVRGARLIRLPNGGAFIYLRHHGNAWNFECGSFVDPKGWMRAPEPAFAGDDRAFYAARSTSAPTAAADGPLQPLVSCIMPTANRRFLVPQAIRYFLNQDYARRELIIVDDGEDCIADLVPALPNIHYMRMPRRQSIGAKRNLACEQAAGDLIAHWDDDDWMASHRLSYQVDALRKAGSSAVCGLSNILYYEPRQQRAWTYHYPERQRRWLAGNTLCYRRQLWKGHPFPNIDEGEDTRFIWSVPESSILALPDSSFYVATMHEQNTSPKRTQDTRWSSVPVSEIERLLGSDISFYRDWTNHASREVTRG